MSDDFLLGDAGDDTVTGDFTGDLSGVLGGTLNLGSDTIEGGDGNDSLVGDYRSAISLTVTSLSFGTAPMAAVPPRAFETPDCDYAAKGIMSIWSRRNWAGERWPRRSISQHPVEVRLQSIGARRSSSTIRKVLIQSRFSFGVGMNRSAQPSPSGAWTKAGDDAPPRQAIAFWKSRDLCWLPWSWRMASTSSPTFALPSPR